MNFYYVISVMSSLRIQNLSKKFGKHSAIHNTTWHAQRGEIVCLLGHSGCGKTTMLRLIAGLESPSSGQISFGDRTLWSHQQNIAAEQRNIGLVFQDYALFPHLNIFENVKFGLTHLNKQQQHQITHDVLAHVSLSQHAKKYPHTLSGGEQQRVALARALAPKPDVLLMDEPFSNLDRRLRDRIRKDTIGILREIGTTTVIVTHDPEEALQIADQIILMHEGEIIQIGTPKQLYETPSSLFSAEYFSTMNQIPCIFEHEQLKSTCGHLHFNIEKMTTLSVQPIHGQEYLFCVRPYHVSLSLTQETADYFAVTVISNEYLGHQQSIDVQIDHTAHIIRVQGIFSCPTQIGQSLFIQFNLTQSFIFSKQSVTN
ncbi:ABC transporter ATP-binding protein [Acinetobacter sp. B5B]|nr:ABC transporter ATP-binding protein [Acinetobacter baretiae]MBF7686187.1 ABC transporter ATP-binding protein [Acinetobacter baretiae]